MIGGMDNKYTHLTNNQRQLLELVASMKGGTLDQLARRATFTRHDSRLRAMLMELRDARLVHWAGSGSWILTNEGAMALSQSTAA